MKNRILYVALLGSMVSSIILSGCKKEEDNTPSKNETESFMDSRDQKTYKWVKIGNQVWMSENLAYTGGSMRHITDNTEWEGNLTYDGWCTYENDVDNRGAYGVLYQWEAAKEACPEGWHLPTLEEWIVLEDYLKDNNYSYDGVTGNAFTGKSLATDTAWNVSSTVGTIGNNDFPAYRNKTGFSALPGGYRWFSDGSFRDLGIVGIWWSASDDDGNSNVSPPTQNRALTPSIFHPKVKNANGGETC